MVVEARLAQANGSFAVSAKRYAVVVGVNDYSESDAENLSFCVSDAEAFYDSLITYCEYDPAHVSLFSDGTHEKAQKPSRSDILAAIATMSAKATEEDSILSFLRVTVRGIPGIVTCLHRSSEKRLLLRRVSLWIRLTHTFVSRRHAS